MQKNNSEMEDKKHVRRENDKYRIKLLKLLAQGNKNKNKVICEHLFLQTYN